MKSYLKNWDLMRILRLGLGILIIAQGVQANDWLIAGLGALFSLMPLLNKGCCSSSSCPVPVRKTNDN